MNTYRDAETTPFYKRQWFAVACVAAFFLLIIGGFALDAVGSTYGRYQARQNASNDAKVAGINERKYDALIAIEKQKAEIKRQEAYGIADAQKIINQTLTPLYVQHEAIQAMERMINSPNHTVVYIPSGANGVPLVQDVSPDAIPDSGK